VRNYTSTVAAEKSIDLIERKLVEAGASHITKEYDKDRRVVALSFTLLVDRKTMQFLPVSLPANVDACLEVLKARRKTWSVNGERADKEQAPRTAWKLLLDWVDVQLSMIEMKQAEPAQVFLPYVKCGNRTFFQAIKDDGFRALPGLPAPKNGEPIEDAEVVG
jgi:hypothetical protein